MALSPKMQALLKGAKNKYGRSTSTTKVKEGRTTVRVIAPKDGERFWADLGVHWIKEEVNGKPTAVVGCHDVVHEEPCAICTAIQKAQATAFDEDTKKLVNEWRPRHTVLLNALVRSGDGASEDPVILEVTKTVFKEMMDIADQFGAEDDENGGVSIFDPAGGRDLNITRSGKGLDTEYSVNVAPKPGKAVGKEALKKLHDLDAFIEKEFFSGDEAKALRSIGNVTGVTINAAPSTAAALTSSAATVQQIEQKVEEDANAAVAELDEAPWEETKTETVVDEADVETVVEDEEDEEAALMKQLEAARAAKAAKAKQTAKPAEKKAASTKAEAPAVNDALSPADVDSLLGELDNIV